MKYLLITINSAMLIWVTALACVLPTSGQHSIADKICALEQEGAINRAAAHEYLEKETGHPTEKLELALAKHLSQWSPTNRLLIMPAIVTLVANILIGVFCWRTTGKAKSEVQQAN